MAAKTIYLLKYNNYFNREIKGQDLTYLGAYTENGAKLVSSIRNMTLWNPNDGVDTVITSKIDMYSIPDYCLVCDPDSDIVISRWFVIEATRIQGGQYTLKLHRDLIADNYNEIMNNEDTYVERGWCDVSNDAIYNKEPITFNQIKKKQILMYDKSCTPWIVGYLNTKSSDDERIIKFDRGAGINTYATIKIPAGGITNSDDCPYTVFCLPYNTVTVTDTTGTSTTTLTQPYKLSRNAAQGISKALSSGNILLDLQLLPFCPNQALIKDRLNIIHSLSTISDLPIYDESNNIIGYVFCSSVNSTSGGIYEMYDSNKSRRLEYTVNNIKEESQTTFCRIVSPNGNGVWEYIPAKQVYADGQSKKFWFRMTAMPYQPYIKVEPENFGRLYGNDYGDTRGLICGGDFSMPQISDSWSAYQINNKNYQNMFNRQIETLDLQQSIQEKQELTSALTGALGATVQGSAIGAMAGGGIGAAIGAGVGLVSSSVGAAVDAYYSKQLRADQRSAIIDQHNYQIGNIQALPYGISKVTNFNTEQPKVPYLEVYTCTDQEVQYLNQYLLLYGYTINRIGKFNNYKKTNNELTHLQGTIIKLTTVNDDSHYLAAISDEVKQGFYIGG